jgi:PAS domain S-box-containing protein
MGLRVAGLFTKKEIQNFTPFISSTLLVGLLLLGINFYAAETQEDAQTWVQETNHVLDIIQNINLRYERTLSLQRGAIITKNPDFIERYNKEKDGLNANLVELTQLSADYPLQLQRIARFQELLIRYFVLLDLRLEDSADYQLVDDADIQEIQENALGLLQKISDREQTLLTNRLNNLSATKRQNQDIILWASLISFIIFLLINWISYRAVLSQASTKEILSRVSERYALAVEGTSDGIYDWDLNTNEMYYSPRLLQMQGYDEGDKIPADLEFVDTHIHPDDRDSVLNSIELYKSGEVRTFDIIFRFRHKDGHYLWINSRGKVLVNHAGKPYRIVGAHTDVTHLKSIEQQLIKEKKQAEKANEAKTSFLANMSHEIRTPLNVITNSAKILSSKKVTPEENQTLLDSLKSSSLILMDLINDFLDISKIEAGEIKLNSSPTRLKPVLDDIYNMLYPKVSDKGLDLIIEVEEKDRLFVDKLRLRQIILNLANNAIKFTDSGQILIKAYSKNGHYHIDVEDTGIGISEEFKKSLFDKYTQANSKTNRAVGGTGLGLNISLQLARLMGGTIKVDSQEHEGTTFSLVLPSNLLIEQDGLKPNASNDEQASPAVGEVDPTNNRILVVEDYDGNLLILKYYLDQLSVAYDIAKNGEEAVHLYKENAYDLVLMDIQMPIMDGFKATETIRQWEQDNERVTVPIVAMTAHALKEDENQCLSHGMTDYLTKPLDEMQLALILSRYNVINADQTLLV